ncbi:unnamed protein product [Lathyrus sativus]|nr:unnamed protein product [Lathyrus sativus]
MKTISWNCRGLGSPRAVRALTRLLRSENPLVVFLMETKLKKEELLVLKRKLIFKFYATVDCRGIGRDRAGGINLWWNDLTEVQVTSYSQNHIAGLYQQEDDDRPWHFAGVYGFPEEENKKETWKLVQALYEEGGDQMIFFGDFNNISSTADKLGGLCKSGSQLN